MNSTGIHFTEMYHCIVANSNTLSTAFTDVHCFKKQCVSIIFTRPYMIILYYRIPYLSNKFKETDEKENIDWL